jgi:hypothetical protein
MEKLISDQVALLEHNYNDVNSEMQRIRGILTVNFCDYDNRKKPPIVTVWNSLEYIKGMSTTQMLIESIDALMKKPAAEEAA